MRSIETHFLSYKPTFVHAQSNAASVAVSESRCVYVGSAGADKCPSFL